MDAHGKLHCAGTKGALHRAGMEVVGWTEEEAPLEQPTGATQVVHTPSRTGSGGGQNVDQTRAKSVHRTNMEPMEAMGWVVEEMEVHVEVEAEQPFDAKEVDR